MNLTYDKYLHLEKLLDSQEPIAKTEHDEHLFIIIHQSFELWFKQILHEGVKLNSLLTQGDFYLSVHTLSRILVILKNLVHQVDILETMTPLSFLSFRDRLESASGFQSWQFRLMEFWLGHKNPHHLKMFSDSRILLQLECFLKNPSVYDHLIEFLKLNGFDFPTDNKEWDSVFAGVYKKSPHLSLLLEKFVDLDEGFQEFRYRHVKMVERTIGNKEGTGGSKGVEYLKNTLFKPSFPELWSARSVL